MSSNLLNFTDKASRRAETWLTSERELLPDAEAQVLLAARLQEAFEVSADDAETGLAVDGVVDDAVPRDDLVVRAGDYCTATVEANNGPRGQCDFAKIVPNRLRDRLPVPSQFCISTVRLTTCRPHLAKTRPARSRMVRVVMPTDLTAAIGQRRAQRLFAVQDEGLVLLVPALIGLISVLLALRNPSVAAAIILTGLQ